MRTAWRSLGITAFLTVLLTQFTNCDVYSDNSVFQTFSSVCAGDQCIQTNPDFLEIKINSEGDIPVAASTNRFNVGGECNEGGYPSNVITWSLYDNTGAFTHDSVYAGKNAACVNGRFQAEVVLTPFSTSPDRTGLLKPGTTSRVSYRLEVELKGIDEKGEVHSNTLAKRQVFLKPI
jgi:hypothetical protein